jgi:hypothetical protein
MVTDRQPFDGFSEADFETYLPHKTRDKAYNNDRLVIKHRLHSLGEMLAGPLKDAGLDLDFKTSLSHPYTYNKYCVDSQWVYFARKEKDRLALKALFGEFLSKDLDMHYSHVILVVEINLAGVEIALKVHQQAWWDGQNVKNRCSHADQRRRFTEELNKLAGFVLSIHDWRKEYVCGKLHEGDLRNYFQYYTPGNHWLHLRLKLQKETVVPMGLAFAQFAGQKLAALVTVYRLIEWRQDNDWVFGHREDACMDGQQKV